MPVPSNADFSVASSIAWFYVIANALRGFTYVPQVVAAWRSRDGARSLSLLTWSAWLVANVAAVLYGLVLRDVFFTCISLINCAGCSLVTGIAARRRRQWKLARRPISSLQPAVTPETSVQSVHRLRSDAADAYVARWGCSARWFDADSGATRHRTASQRPPPERNGSTA